MAEGAESELEALISEYLTNRGFLQTVAAFQTESRRRPKPAMPTQTTRLQRDFIVAYECGEREAFFNLWNQNVPKVTLERDLPTGDRAHSLKQFTDYLATRNTLLSKLPHLTTFCALPYIPNPSSHPSFKALFTESWSLELKSRLVHFLKLSLKSTSSQPKLLSLFLSDKVALTTAGSAQEVVVLRDQLTECRRKYTRRLTEMQDNYHTLVGIALELLDALEAAISGQQVTPESIQSICSRLFGSSLPDGVTEDDVRPSTATSFLRQSVISMRETVQTPVNLHTSTPIPETPSPPSPPPLSHPHTLTLAPPHTLTPAPSHTKTSPHKKWLDYQRIKTELECGNDKRKALLLQALRWRLTRAVSPDNCQSAIHDFIGNDLLGCSDDNDSYHVNLTSLLESPSSVVCEQLCRLLNAVSSLSRGRAYLAQSQAMVGGVCGVLVGGCEGGEGCVARNALGAVQKLSLKRQLQGLMIEQGLPVWVAGVLSQEDAPSDYVLRYCLALLMNLSLRAAGRWACLGAGPHLLRSLGDLLEHEDEEICSYVNGILYSLLSVPQLKTEARGMGMGDMLTSALEASPPSLKSQIHYIISQLNSEDTPPQDDDGDETPPTDDSADEEDEEEGDVVEGDEDEVAIATSGLVGESLLVQYEVCELMSEAVPDDQIMTSSRKGFDAPFTRPVTPHSHCPISKTTSAVNAVVSDYRAGGRGQSAKQFSSTAK